MGIYTPQQLKGCLLVRRHTPFGIGADMGCMTLRQMLTSGKRARAVRPWRRLPNLVGCSYSTDCTFALMASTSLHPAGVAITQSRRGSSGTCGVVSTRDCGRGRDHLSVPGLRHAELHGQRPRQVSRPQFFSSKAQRCLDCQREGQELPNRTDVT